MIQIKRNNKVFFTLEDFGEGSKLSYQLMDHHYVILKFTTATPIYFEIGDSVEIPDFGYFELTSSYFPKHNDSDGYDYEMQMDAYYMSWKNKLCKYRPQHGANETSFNLTTTVGVHMNVILGNLKALGLTYNGKEFSVDYTTYNNKAFDVQKRFLIEYGSISILDALNAICSEDALNCEWWIDGSIIYLGYCEMEGQTTFEQDVNVLSMSYSESKSTYITRLYAFGSDRNIPKGYFTGADADVTTDGVATDYLMLPNKEVDSDGFYAKDGYLENVNVVKNDKQAIEGVVMFDEEYPKVESVVSSIKTYDSTVDNEDGTKTTQTFWQVTSTDSFTNNFKESWIKSNLTLGIKFTSGALMGMEFEVSFKVIDKANYFEIVANDTYGRTLPDGVMCPKVGDKFFLYNWDATKITDTDLIPTAQLSLFDRAKQYYQKTMISNSNFTCTMDGDKFYNDGTYDYHPLGEQVKLINDMFAQVDADGKHYRNSRIIGMEIPLDIPYDHPQYTVGEKAATSRLGKLEDKVDSIKVNGMQIGGTGSGNGGVYVIGLNDSTPASDSNVYSSRRSRMEFVSRLQDNTAKGTITWEKIQKLLSGLVVGDSNSENGGSWTPDAEGRSHLITDYLEVRMKAIFEELVIKKTSTIGGKEIISPAGGVVAHKVEEVTVTYNNVSQKAYRCYFLAEQEGDAVDNDFSVNDQVRSESFNVRKGTYHKVGNHFYWRLVIGRDEDPVELEGKKYHYIDLSDTDCATASDVPAKGDVLSQCGNRTDIERQNCLIFSAVDTYSPSIGLYHGINSYSFANREYVEYGVNKQTNKAFFNVYGDMYVGDRPTKENNYEGSSYIKYDSAAKQVSVKGKISAKSTVDGKELSLYIKENSAKGLTEEQVNNLIKNSQVIVDLQNQVDGAIETWFYEGVPTLTNAPASSWTTDKDKDTHLGDLYYDNKTGKAYRFAKDGNTYKWTIITDTDIAKALSDASKAQETADGKMKVFSTQPTPPYQVGDIWVNATYPSDGSTYKNEVLRCQTDKKAGSQFTIADWIKASKYTDDTVANAAKKAAEDAQKAAQTAQTDITNLGKTVTGNKKAFDNYVKDGYLEPSEIAAMAQDSKRLEDDFAAAEKSYNEVKGAEVLKSTKELSDLNTAFTTLTTAKKELIEYLSDISARYNAADTKGKATIVSAVGTKFTNFQSAYSAFYDKLGLANAYITSKIYGDLGVVIGDVTSLAYLKKALMDAPDTEINGGLVLTSLIGLRDTDGNTTAGINGITEKSAKGGGIAAWFGGEMVDKDYNDGSKTSANTIFRFDGSGYVAGGAIWWGTDGRVHADPTSFIISEKNLGAYLTFFEPTWKAGSAGTSVADLVSLKPNAPFSKLGVSGDATFEGTITFHGIKLTYDATNKAIKIDGNLYATGGISAYGASSGAGGGGLNASVISYARILEGSYTDADLTSIPNAYAIKALSSRIDNIATELGGLNLSWNNITGKPSTFAPSAHTHKWTEITDRITKVSQLTNDAGYLTTHQSLASYYTKTEIDAKGYTTNKGTVTSVSLTLPTGLACATKTITTSGTFAITLASGYSIPTTAKQTAWDGAVSAKHTHSNKSVLDGITSAKVTHWDSAYDWYALMTTDEETADGIINKWNEVVSFLANIAQTDTLSGIVNGINKSISDEVTRAKKAEGVNASGISTNKTNITTLQGYFTSGSAKKALQLTNARTLWGNSFNGTADINGSIIVPSGKYISIGNIKMEYDATNKALKITNTTTNEVANLYTSGGVSAYGVGTSSSSGGGLNGSVKAYADAIRLTTENLSEIASAYSVAKLYSEIQNVASAVPSISVSVPTGGNALTGATYDASTGVITFTKGTFLTAHQSLDGYVNAIAVSGSGNAVTAVTKSGKTITFTKGATYLTSHQSLAAYMKTTDANNTFSRLGHLHGLLHTNFTKTIDNVTTDNGWAMINDTYRGFILKSLRMQAKAPSWVVDNYAAGIAFGGEDTKGVLSVAYSGANVGFKIAGGNGVKPVWWMGFQGTSGTSYNMDNFSTKGHTHGYASSVKLGETSYAASSNVISLPAYPTALKSPTAVTIQANGTSLGSYDGSAAKTFNLTYANVGAASAGHNHDSVYSKLGHTHSYLPLSGGTLTGGLTVNSNVTSSGIGTFKVLRVGSVDIKVDDSGNLYVINKDGKTAANFYATGGITAYGEGSGSSGGGGLNGSVKSYADALKLASESLSEIASAYSIKALDSRISSLEGGSATAISVSGSGNAVTSVTKNGTTISVVKGSTFLTSHQSLDGYVNNITTSGTGNAITSITKSGKTLTFTKGATFLTSHQSLSAYLKSADAANTYLKLSGGAMTGNISYKGSKNTYDMIRFVDNNVDIYGNGICIGGGGLTIIGGGESASEVLKQHTNGGDENMIVANDAAIDFFSNMNSGWDSRKAGSFDTSGYWNGVGFKKNNSNDNYVLTGGGGHKAISTLSVSYASSAGSANSVAWSNVSGRPTKVSQFTNDSNYATQSWVTGKGYLTSHQDISGKVNRTGDYLDTDSDRWWISNSEFGINLHNSDIVGVNSIYTSDVSNGPEESISFKRSNGNYDTLRMADGVIWFGTDYALNKTINEYQILHTNNIRITGKSNGFIDMSAGGVIKQAYIYAIGSIDGYKSYPDGRTTSINDYDKGLNRLFLTHSTSSLPASQRPLGKDGHILHFGWDNSSGWDAQLAISANGDNPYIAIRAQYSGTWRNWYGAALLKCTNYITGNGGLIVERTDKNLDTYMGVSNGTYDIRLMIGSGNVNRGIYDVSTGNWMLYRDSSMNIYMTGSVLATGGITAYSSSDIRLKQDLRKLDFFGIIKAMGGTFGFAWKKDNTRSIGWIAQHVLCNPHLKDIVETDENGYYKINYWSPKLIATAFGAIEQVGDEVSRLKARVVFLESEVQRLSGDKGDCNKKRLDNKNINLLN
nr:MAG TPA: tail protein [Caudoviricetes sp.]